MKILYIDTSSSYLYAGIVSSGKLLCEVKKEFGHSLSEEALPSIVGLFNERNLKATDIDKIIVVNGPGSFTGIRIGITIAKVFAWSLNIPITTISALEAMSLSSKTNMLHVPILDARRGYVFGAIYDQDNSAIFSPKHIKLEELLQELQDKENYKFLRFRSALVPIVNFTSRIAFIFIIFGFIFGIIIKNWMSYIFGF